MVWFVILNYGGVLEWQQFGMGDIKKGVRLEIDGNPYKSDRVSTC